MIQNWLSSCRVTQIGLAVAIGIYINLQAVNNTRAVCLKNKLKIGFNKLTIKSEQCCCNAYFMARFCVRAVKSTPAGTAVVGPTIPAKAQAQVLVQASASSVTAGPQVQGIEGPPMTPLGTPLASTTVAEASASQKTVGPAATATQGDIAAPASSIANDDLQSGNAVNAAATAETGAETVSHHS